MNDKDKKIIEVDNSFIERLSLLLCGNENEKGILKTFEENEWCFRASEENVRSEIIDPILKTVGWEIPYLRREDHNRDYLLCSQKYAGKDSTRIVIEAKKYREQLKTSSEGDDNSQNSPEGQLVGYINDKNEAHYTEFGILTNGIRWCLYQNDKCIGEINIKEIKEKTVEICSFFKLISFESLRHHTIDDYNIEHIECKKNRFEPMPPNSIVIDREVFLPRKGKHAHCYANYCVIEKCLKKEGKAKLFEKEFFRDIVFDGKNKSKEWRTNHISETDNSVKMIGDYNIYDKMTLLQEINSTLDLGLSISVE